MVDTRPIERDLSRPARERRHGRRLVNRRKVLVRAQVEPRRRRLDSSIWRLLFVVLPWALTFAVSQPLEAGPPAGSVPLVQAATSGSTAATVVPLLSSDAGLPADPHQWTCRSSRCGATQAATA